MPNQYTYYNWSDKKLLRDAYPAENWSHDLLNWRRGIFPWATRFWYESLLLRSSIVLVSQSVPTWFRPRQLVLSDFNLLLLSCSSGRVSSRLLWDYSISRSSLCWCCCRDLVVVVVVVVSLGLGLCGRQRLGRETLSNHGTLFETLLSPVHVHHQGLRLSAAAGVCCAPL